MGISTNVMEFGVGLNLEWLKNIEYGGVCVRQALCSYLFSGWPSGTCQEMVSQRSLLLRVATVTRKARKSFPVSRNKMHKRIMEKGGQIQYLSAKHYSKSYFSTRVSTHELPSNLKSVSLLYN